MKLSMERWSWRLLSTSPRRAIGDSRIIGTRNPSPFGGRTWSKKPPQSSQTTNTARWGQSGLFVTAFTTLSRRDSANSAFETG